MKNARFDLPYGGAFCPSRVRWRHGEVSPTVTTILWLPFFFFILQTKKHIKTLNTVNQNECVWAATAGYAGWQLENETLRQMLRPVLRRLCRLRPHQIIVSCQAPWQLHLHPSLARTLQTLITRIHVTTSGGSSWPNLIQNYFLLMRNIRAKCSKLRLLWQKDSPVDLKLGERSTLPMASW